MKAIIDFLAQLFAWEPELPIETTSLPPSPMPPTPPLPIDDRDEKLYELAKSLRGQRLTLDPTVPRMVGCAQAVSKVLALFGTKIPTKGISGTAALGDYFRAHPELFESTTEEGAGHIWLYETGKGNGKCRGHVFIEGYNSLMSNNSETGLWSDHWQKQEARNFYEGYGAIPRSLWKVL